MQKYYVKYQSGWAYVILDEESGLISVVSDWGTWSHICDSTGDKPFLEFIIGVGPAYFRDKFQAQMGGYWFDFEATLTKLKQDIKEMTSVEDHKELMLELFDLEPVSAEAYLTVLRNTCPNVYALYPEIADIPFVTDYHPRLAYFMDNVWPDFVEIWKSRAF